MSSSFLDGSGVTEPTNPNSSVLPRTVASRRNTVLTLADVVDHLFMVEEINSGQSRAILRAVKAAKAAARSFITYSTQGFKYYESRGHITFNADVALGEVTVSSNVITPTTAPSWPSWMQLATIRVDNKSYPVLSYTSGTATVSGLPDGTYSTATLQQSYARLPSDFRRRGSLTDGNRTYPVENVPAGVLQSWEEYYEWANSAGDPLVFGAITGDSRFHNELLLAVWPTYQSQRTLALHYERYMSSLDYHRVGDNTGTNTITTSGTTATAVSSIFTDDHLGCAITFSTGATGEIVNTLSSTDLVAAQRIITAVNSGTECEIDNAITGDISAKSFYISDVVDVQRGAAEEAFLRLAEYEFARSSRSKYANQRFAEFRKQMDIAMADDSRYRESVDDVPRSTSGYWLGDVTSKPT